MMGKGFCIGYGLGVSCTEVRVCVVFVTSYSAASSFLRPRPISPDSSPAGATGADDGEEGVSSNPNWVRKEATGERSVR